MKDYTTKECKSQYHKGDRVIDISMFQHTSSWKNACKDCISEMRRQERTRNKKRVSREQKKWRERNKEHKQQYDKEYRESNVGYQKRSESYERNRQQKRTYDKHRRQNEPGVREKYNATAAKYRASKLQATPHWFEKDQVEAMYHKSKTLTEETGIKHHVDHIVPLQGELVCGLHCLDNLQLLPDKENIAKSNKFDV